MAIDTSLVVYLPTQDVFGRDVTVTALASRAGAVYAARGILDTRGTMIQTEAGYAVLSDHETILDIRSRDDGFFGGPPPAQGDMIYVPPDGENTDGVGTYYVTDTSWNGGGEITLVLQEKVDAISIGQQALVASAVFVNANSFKVPVVT